MLKNLFKNLFLSIYLILIAGCATTHQELIPPDETSNLAQESRATVDISDLKSTIQTSTPTITSSAQSLLIQRIPFPTSEYARLSKSGNSTIQGNIYVISINGQKVFGKNTRLYLNPVTSYSKQWYNESYIGKKKLSKADSRLYNYLRFTTSDSRGQFSFFGVPSGRYYLIGIVRCKEECGYDSIKNIRIAKEISVDGSGSVNVELSRTVN
jgi:hypothetical protein